jgi:phosphoribosylformimino-5-aminoimidazole carboxamide ribotide isomerase
MAFTIYPAIDLRGGKCVRLIQGDYQRETVYAEDPVEVARKWQQEGAEWLHLVDLDAARTGEWTNLSVIEQILAAVSIPVQVGGGVRNLQRLERLLDKGVARVVIGSAAIDQPEFVRQALSQYADQIAIGIDARDGKVATHGWLQTSEVSFDELAKQMVQLGAKRFIFTDISRDGMLSGVNLDAVRHLARTAGVEVIASGGVRTLKDIERLYAHQAEGIGGVIIGKALYTGQIQLKEARKIGG